MINYEGPRNLGPSLVFAVANAHTYFVGSVDDALWVHNCEETTGNKRGTKPKGTGAHNLKIEEIGEHERKNGNEIVSGGGGKERLVSIPSGGHKAGRRPDIELAPLPGAKPRAIQVGRTKKDRSPVKREQEAIEDLESAGYDVEFEPYD